MHNLLKWGCGLGVFFYLSTALALDVIDDHQHRIHLSQPAKKIISLAPDLTENLFAINAGNQVIATVAESQFPLAAKSIPRVGSYHGLDLEKILLLHPDLIIAWDQAYTKELDRLNTLGIPVYVTHPRNLEDIAETIKNLGVLTGHENEANKQATHFLAELNKLKKQYQSREAVSVFYQIGDSLYTVNHESWINDIFVICGGRNIFANERAIAFEANLESVIEANPSVIISDDMTTVWKTRWMKWGRISAVQKNRMYNIYPDWVEGATPRLLMGAKAVCEYLDAARNPSSA